MAQSAWRSGPEGLRHAVERHRPAVWLVVGRRHAGEVRGLVGAAGALPLRDLADTGRAAACDRPCPRSTCDAMICVGAVPVATHCSIAAILSNTSVPGPAARSGPCPAPCTAESTSRRAARPIVLDDVVEVVDGCSAPATCGSAQP